MDGGDPASRASRSPKPRERTRLWGIGEERGSVTHVSLPSGGRSRLGDVVLHRRAGILVAERRQPGPIPVTSPALTLIDNANELGARRLEKAVNEADRLGLVHPERVRSTAARHPRIPGARLVRQVLDRLTFSLTDSELERIFLGLVSRALLPHPLTQQWLEGYRVDFYWPDLGLIVEADSLRYHRTASDQATDRRRDQAHAALGLQTLRFTHHDIAFEPALVAQTLDSVMGHRHEAAARRAWASIR